MVKRMDRHQMRLSLLKVSLLALGVSTWIFWSFVFATRPEEVAPEQGDALASLVRLPASLPAQIPGMTRGPTSRASDPIEMEAVTLTCWDKSSTEPVETSARWVRLTGRHCSAGAALKVDGVTVRNISTGYTATVFATAEKVMTTDFMPLSPGRNEIVIRFDGGEGAAVESQFTLTRD